MKVDDMNGETLEYWSDKAVARLAELRAHGGGDKVLRIVFEDDAADPLNSLADTMAVILGLHVNLTCEYTKDGLLIGTRNAWTARCGWPGLREISIRGDTEQEAVTRLFVAMLIGREVSDPSNVRVEQPHPVGSNE
jgi:hypothetical protein